MLPNVTKLTPAEVAAFTFRLTGGKPNLQATADSFLRSSADWTDIAEKAVASSTGKWRGVTAAEARAVAADLKDRAESVPAELRKLMA